MTVIAPTVPLEIEATKELIANADQVENIINGQIVSLQLEHLDGLANEANIESLLARLNRRIHSEVQAAFGEFKKECLGVLEEKVQARKLSTS